MKDFESVWAFYSDRVEAALRARLVADHSPPERLHQAVQYACLGGGKRFRAMLVYAFGELAGATLDILDTPASAVEMVHAYSLVHDDLPGMDDDDLRRGRPTCHIQFDEPTAILVGDALQSRAFEVLASDQWNRVDDKSKMQMVTVLASAIGSQGMAGGQALDMESTGHLIEKITLEQMHKLKTGALIEASAVLGGLSMKRIDDPLLVHFREFAQTIGLAFQIADDILDYTSTNADLGKPVGADERMNKSTYVSILGLDEARASADKLSKQAIESIRGLGDNTDFLAQLADFVVTRKF